MAFKIALNGANFVDTKRERAFEAALAESDGQLAHVGGNGQSTHAETQPPPARSAAAQAKAGPDGPGATVVVHDYDRVLGGLELGLAKSYDHQSETLRVHQQYLDNQAAYASIFSQLMQEQGALVSGDALSSEKSAALLQILQSLSRSVEQFHAHQAETLQVHGQFLDQQAAYSEAFVGLLESHYGTALGGGVALPKGNGNGNGRHHTGNGNGHHGGNGNGNGHHPTVPTTVSSSAPVVTAVVAPPEAPEPSPAASTPAAAVSAEVLGEALLGIVSEKTGYPAEMLELDMDMEADLGIDSIKRVEILGALQDAYPALPDVDTEALAELRTLGDVLNHMSAATAPAGAAPSPDPVGDAAPVAPTATSTDATPAAASETLGDELLVIVSEKTGYPAEMLELDMDLEADLGIDSIKRVEILGALQDQHPDLPEVDAEALAELRTLAQILDYIKEGAAPKA